MKDYLFGIDLGGTKIEGVVLKSDSLDVIERLRINTEQKYGYQHIVRRIKLLISSLEQKTGVQATNIGIGTPGCLMPDSGLIKNSNTLCLNGRPLQMDLECATGKSFQISNDANCFALAEYKMGIVSHEFPKAKSVFGVIMGTGVGGGLVIDGKVLYGRHGIAGEWGHNTLIPDEKLCYCGRIGCVETVISGPALEEFYFQISGLRKDLKEISLGFGKETAANETINHLVTYFGKAIAVVVNIFDPDVIVLGGGVGNIRQLYEQGADEISKHTFNHEMTTPLLKPMLGDSAGVFGAALLCQS